MSTKNNFKLKRWFIGYVASTTILAPPIMKSVFIKHRESLKANKTSSKNNEKKTKLPFFARTNADTHAHTRASVHSNNDVNGSSEIKERKIIMTSQRGVSVSQHARAHTAAGY